MAHPENHFIWSENALNVIRVGVAQELTRHHSLASAHQTLLSGASPPHFTVPLILFTNSV